MSDFCDLASHASLAKMADRCDISCVKFLLLVALYPEHGPTVAKVSSGHLFWVGALIGLGIGLAPFVPWVIKVAGLFIAFLGAGVVHVTHGGHISPAIVPWVLVGAGGIIVGLFYGRARGLAHLGQADFRGRLNAIRNISRF